MSKIKNRENLIDGLHINSTYTAIGHFWLIQQMVNAKEWKFVTDEDASLMSALYRVFSKDIQLYNAHHFVSKIDKNKTSKQKFQEYLEANRYLTEWGASRGLTTRSLYTLAEHYLREKLKTHHFCK